MCPQTRFDETGEVGMGRRVTDIERQSVWVNCNYGMLCTVKYCGNNSNGAFAQWTALDQSTVSYGTTSSIDHTNGISLPTTAKTTEMLSARGHMTYMSTGM